MPVLGWFLDGLAGFFMIGMGWLGFRRGIVEELGRILGLIAATLVAMNWYIDGAGLLLRQVALDPWIALVVSYALIFTIVLLISRFLTHLVHYLVVASSTKWMNRGLGFGFGVLKGAIIAAMVVWLIDISPFQSWGRVLHDNSFFVKWTTKTRTGIIKGLGWTDPAGDGEAFLKDLMIKGDLPGESR